MRVLGHQVPTTGGKRIDILGLDSENTLVIIEIKIVEDTYILPQGLEYVDWVNENADRLSEIYSKPDLKVDPSKTPRLILVAPSFSYTLQKAAKYISRDYCFVTLLEYFYFRYENDKKGLFCREIPLQPIERPVIRYENKDYIEYIQKEESRKLFEQVMDKIQKIGPKIEANPTQSWYIALQYKGRNLASLSPRSTYFYLGIKEEDGWDYPKIEKPEDFTQEHINMITNEYIKLGKPNPTI